MESSRRNAMRSIAAIGPLMLLGAKAASAASDAAQITQNATAALHRLYAADHRAAELGERPLESWCSPRS